MAESPFSIDKTLEDWATLFKLLEEGKIKPVVDQAALHGLLAKIRDLNLTLMTVERVELDQTGGNKK